MSRPWNGLLSCWRKHQSLNRFWNFHDFDICLGENSLLKGLTPSATLSTLHLQELWTAKEQSAQQVFFYFTMILSRIQVYASVYINGNLYSQHHIKQCKKKSETAAANIFQCKQNPGATSQLFPKPQSFNNINKTSQGQNPPPIHSQPPVETVEVQDLPRHHTWPRHRFVQCPVRVVKFGDGIKQNMNPTVSKVLLYILYIHIFATTYAKIQKTCSLLDTSLNLISKSKWRKNLLSGKKMWLCVCWSHSPPTCRRVKSRPRKHLLSCMGGHVGVSTLDIKSGESI